MINLGKTHTVEFAYGGWGTNQHLGTPWNPWDADDASRAGRLVLRFRRRGRRRLAPWAIGTDTGGSVRIPAAWNGITGLKTTIGRVSTYGVLPLSPTLDTPGPITRDVEDAALLLTVLQGADARDPHTHGVRDVDPMPDLQSRREGPAPRPLAGSMNAAASMPRCWPPMTAPSILWPNLGADIVDPPLPARFADLGAINGRIMSAECYAALADLVDDNAQPLDQDVRPRVRAGAAISSRDYLRRAGRARAHEASLRRRDRRHRRAADSHRGDTRHSGRLDRSEHDACDVHALGQFPRSVRVGGAERIHRRRPADVAADRLPRLRRAVGAADRPRLPIRPRLAPEASSAIVDTTIPPEELQP